MKIDISEMNKVDILKTLYDNAKFNGLGMFAFELGDMPITEAIQIMDMYEMKYNSYFDYLKGRVLKIDLSGPVLNTYLYDRDNIVPAGELLKSLPGFKAIEDNE